MKDHYAGWFPTSETPLTGVMPGLVSFKDDCISPKVRPLDRGQQYSKLYP